MATAPETGKIIQYKCPACNTEGRTFDTGDAITCKACKNVFDLSLAPDFVPPPVPAPTPFSRFRESVPEIRIMLRASIALSVFLAIWSIVSCLAGLVAFLSAFDKLDHVDGGMVLLGLVLIIQAVFWFLGRRLLLSAASLFGRVAARVMDIPGRHDADAL